ncbi:MAG: hypothetical protein J3K34DRAFT_525562, partial [Monoraphidium minutum]
MNFSATSPTTTKRLQSSSVHLVHGPAKRHQGAVFGHGRHVRHGQLGHVCRRQLQRPRRRLLQPLRCQPGRLHEPHWPRQHRRVRRGRDADVFVHCDGRQLVPRLHRQLQQRDRGRLVHLLYCWHPRPVVGDWPLRGHPGRPHWRLRHRRCLDWMAAHVCQGAPALARTRREATKQLPGGGCRCLDLSHTQVCFAFSVCLAAHPFLNDARVHPTAALSTFSISTAVPGLPARGQPNEGPRQLRQTCPLDCLCV